MFENCLIPDPKLVKIREKKVAALKKVMGDKYLIAKSMPRITERKGAQHE
jgi:hypothetical protein